MRTTSLRDNPALPAEGLVTWRARDALDCAATLHAIARDCIRKIRASRDLAIAGAAEAVHTMRIELTRLRAAARFFEPWISKQEWQLLDAELDWLNTALGRARNLDVTVEHAAQKRYRDLTVATRRKLLRSRKKAYRRLADRLHSARYVRLVSELDRWLRKMHGPEDQGKAPLARADQYCERTLRTWRHELWSEGRRARDLGRKQLHQLRIASKNYRYVVESLLDQDISVTREDFAFCERAEEIQRDLGEVRDLRRLRKAVGRLPHYRRRKRKLLRQVERSLRNRLNEL